jgi:hypothetical protein
VQKRAHGRDRPPILPAPGQDNMSVKDPITKASNANPEVKP